MFSDFRFAVRTLAKRPGPSLLAILALALGIGLVATQFSFVNGVIIKGLPFPDSDRIFILLRAGPEKREESAVPMRDFLLWSEQQKSFAGLAAFESTLMNLSGSDFLPLRRVGGSITSSLFPILGVQPVLGRSFQPADDQPGAPLVAVLGEGIWERDFARDPQIVGRSIRINGEAATVIGIMPGLLRFPQTEEIWTNLRPQAGATAFGFPRVVHVAGKLRQGVSLQDARAELDVLASRLASQFPDTNEGFTRGRVVRFTDHFNGNEARPILFTMLGMVAGVLLIACTNVANLLLARAAHRGRELAIRGALGATRGRLFRQMLSEGLVLAFCGALLGVLLAVWGTQVIDRQLAVTNAPFWFNVSIDGRVLLVVLLVTVLAGLASGLLPALQASRADVSAALKDEGHAVSSLRLGRFSKLLVVVQVAVSCGLLVVTVLMAKSVVLAKTTKFPFDPSHVVSARVELMDREFPEGRQRNQFYEQMLQEVRALPGVQAATLTSRNPVQPGVYTSTEIEGRIYERDVDVPRAQLEVIAADYFKTLGITLLQGRDFSESDTAEGPSVAIVNESFARMHWPGESPLGKRLRRVREGQRWATVIGVAPDLQMQGALNADRGEGYYLLQKQESWGWMTVLLRPSGSPEALAQPIREIVARLASNQPVHSIGLVSRDLDQRLAVPRFISRMFIVFGAAALFLGALGLYGVTSFSVNQRTREFGIRFALGAKVGDVLRMVFRQGSIQLAAGLVAGLLLAFALSRPLAFLLAGVSPSDPLVYGAVALGVTAIALVAIWLPARRASRIDPMLALRNE